uniref:Uncharacterized protein n=1 Tax=Glossina brevipalpis TaxID=37001 RepID=A0A1A9WR53_9MUSC
MAGFYVQIHVRAFITLTIKTQQQQQRQRINRQQTFLEHCGSISGTVPKDVWILSINSMASGNWAGRGGKQNDAQLLPPQMQEFLKHLGSTTVVRVLYITLLSLFYGGATLFLSCMRQLEISIVA